jgi:hypothetical protein
MLDLLCIPKEKSVIPENGVCAGRAIANLKNTWRSEYAERYGLAP